MGVRNFLLLLIFLTAGCMEKPMRLMLELKKGTDLPIVDASIGDIPIKALIDTGSSAVVVSSSLLHRKDGETIFLPKICFHNLCFNEVRTLVKDTAFSNMGEIQAIIGMPILQHLVVEHDGLRSVTLLRAMPACKGRSYAMQPDKFGRPHIAIHLDDQRVDDFLIDTGAARTLLDASTISRLQTYVTAQAQPDKGCSFSSCDEKVLSSMIKQVCIADQCTDDVAIKYPVWNALGFSFLEHFRFAMDFVRQEIIFCE